MLKSYAIPKLRVELSYLGHEQGQAWASQFMSLRVSYFILKVLFLFSLHLVNEKSRLVLSCLLFLFRIPANKRLTFGKKKTQFISLVSLGRFTQRTLP